MNRKSIYNYGSYEKCGYAHSSHGENNRLEEPSITNPERAKLGYKQPVYATTISSELLSNKPKMQFGTHFVAREDKITSIHGEKVLFDPPKDVNMNYEQLHNEIAGFTRSEANKIEIVSLGTIQAIKNATDKSAILRTQDATSKCNLRRGRTVSLTSNVNDTVSELCDNIDPQNPQNLSAYRSATLLVREDKSFKYPQGFGNLEANTQSIEKKVTELCDVNCASADCLSCNTTDVNSQAVLKRKRLSLLAKYCDPDVTLTNSCNNTVIQKDISLLKQDAASSNSKSPAEYDGNNQIGLICTSTSACNSIGCQSSSDETKKSCKDECKKQSIVTQRTIIYPENGLEPCFANSIYCFKYENVNNVEVEDMKVANSVADQKKEQIDADKAVSVLNIMLQRHLANGNQNGSFIQTKEPVNGSYSVLSEDKITKLDSVDSAKDSLLNANRCDLPSSCTDYFSVSSERKTEVAMDYKTECAAQEPNENFDRYSSEKNVKSTPLKWCSDRSTVRDRMPRGQTRRLALLFETMSDAACTEMLREYDNLKRRGKSVPPAFTNKNYQRKYDLGTQQYDRGVSEFTMEPTNHPSDFNRARTYQHSIFGEHLEDSRSNMEVRNVRNIESRLESSLNGSPSISRNIYVDGKQQKLANQEKYLHIDTKDSKPIPDGDSDKSILKNYYGAPTNYDLYKNAKQPSRQSNKWFGYIDHENSSSPSQNSMCGNASYIGVWDHQQYELGLLKGVTNLKRYDSRSNKALDEQARFRRIDHSIERHPEFHSKIVGDRFQRGYGEDIGREVMDNVAEVEKAFDFVNKTESVTTAGMHSSQESLEKTASSPERANYSLSLYRDLQKKYHSSPTSSIPIRFSPAAYSQPPCAGERLAVYKSNELAIESSKSLNRTFTLKPVATSTPLDGSPVIGNRVLTSVSETLNHSEISSISSWTTKDGAETQQSEMDFKTLRHVMLVQEDQIAQASVALAHCKKTNSFNGTLVELSAQRSLLLARERLLALQNQMERLKMCQLIKRPIPRLSKYMRGAIDLTSINVYLNRNFCVRNTDENVSYAFVVLLKANEQVEATQTVSLMDSRALRVSKVHFSDQIRFKNLPVDFTVMLEIYALKVSEDRRSDEYSCNMLKNKAKSLLAKKAYGNESVVGCSEFTCCGHICLNRDTVGIQKFYLDGAVYPLEGTIEIDSRCTKLPPVIETDFRGFLTMYQVISGLGSWARYWAVLRRGIVHFWKYPNDEACEKPALACMDLSKCIDKKINRASHEICSRPNAFTVDLLVPTSPSLIEKKRVLLAADTKKLCNAWLNAMNETLEILRG